MDASSASSPCQEQNSRQRPITALCRTGVAQLDFWPKGPALLVPDLPPSSLDWHLLEDCYGFLMEGLWKQVYHMQLSQPVTGVYH